MRDYEDDDVACSHFPIPIYNYPLSVRTGVLVGQLMQTGKPFVVREPLTCSTCTAATDPETIKIEEGEILCSTGYCAMEVISFFCAGKRCQKRVYPDGRDVGVVLLSCTTASTAVLMRDIAGEMTTSGSTVGRAFAIGTSSIWTGATRGRILQWCRRSSGHARP